MENILLQKANYLAEESGIDVTIITTDQQRRGCFFPISPKIHLIDLDINYCDAKRSKFWHLKKLYLHKLHKKRLTQVLHKERFDICISMMDFDFKFLPDIKDGSKKVAEYHFSRYAKALSATNPVKRYFQSLRTYSWISSLKKLDRFIVLTTRDKEQWGDLKNMEVIPNFISRYPTTASDLNHKRIISVGRYSYQKGFDMLLKAWSMVQDKLSDWELVIFGGGDKTVYEDMVNSLNLERATLNPPTADIGKEYLESSMYVMSSRFEGLPLVLLEAMSYGLPVISFDCPCGPSDIIKPEFGVLVENGDVEQLAASIIQAASAPDWLKSAGVNARSNSLRFLKPEIMSKWESLFSDLMQNLECVYF